MAGERLDDYVLERQNYIEDERRKRRTELQAKELEECTFSPKTNVSKTGSQRCVEDRLKWRVEKQRRRVSVGIMEGLAQAELSNQHVRINKMSKEKKQEAIAGLVDRLYQNAIEMSIKRDLEFRKNMMKPAQRNKSRSQSSQREDRSSRRHSVRSVNVHQKVAEILPKQAVRINRSTNRPKPSPKRAPQKRPAFPLALNSAQIPTSPMANNPPISNQKPRRLSAKFAQSDSKRVTSPPNISPQPKRVPVPKPKTGSPGAIFAREDSPATNPAKKVDESTSELKTVKKASAPLLVFDLMAGRERQIPNAPMNTPALTNPVISPESLPDSPTQAPKAPAKPSSSPKRNPTPRKSTRGPQKSVKTGSYGIQPVQNTPKPTETPNLPVFAPKPTQTPENTRKSQAHEYLEGLSQSDRTGTREPTKAQLKTLRYKPLAVYEEESEKDCFGTSQELNVNLIVQTPDSRRNRDGSRDSYGVDHRLQFAEENSSSEQQIMPSTNLRLGLQNAKSGEQIVAKRGMPLAKETSSSPLFVKRAVPNQATMRRIDHIFHNKPFLSTQHSGSHSAISKQSKKDLTDRISRQDSKLDIQYGDSGQQVDSMLDLHPEEGSDSPRGQFVVTKAHLKTLY